MHILRFPLRNQSVLEKWENAMRNINQCSDWKATHTSRICSNHFHRIDYITPLTEQDTCRLKSTAVPTIFPQVISSQYGISKTLRRKIEIPCDQAPLTTICSEENVADENTYSKNSASTIADDDTSRTALEEKLRRKIKSLQQQLRRTKAKKQTMTDIIHELEQKLMLSAEDAENMHVKFDELQLSLFNNTRNNVSCAPC